ncbi:DUF421 domain-containing protein [Lentibacillus sediminis]|uniref:DUF421 domain-containing protein n=1 Tax=Lentibacillus sediminis TaxID=1940529 RepID=UPI000C1C5A40|nr:DUF421 domain-containing protein [Lentibacillus sediminis]
MGLAELLLRITLGFFVLFTLTRIMGSKEISQMTFFNFVSAIAIGSISASLVIFSDVSIRNGLIALVGWAIFTLLLGYGDIKSHRLRKITTGDPQIVIREGRIAEDTLRKTRLDLEELNAMLREKDVFSIKDVDYAIFETNGKLSVLKNELAQPLTKKSSGNVTQAKIFPIPTALILDGKIHHTNLAKLNLGESWLNQQLQHAGITSVVEVFYAEVQQDGTLHIDQKENDS